MKPETAAPQIETIVSVETTTRPWQHPVITHIDIKRTLFDGGSLDDGQVPSNHTV